MRFNFENFGFKNNGERAPLRAPSLASDRGIFWSVGALQLQRFDKFAQRGSVLGLTTAT